MSEPNPLIAFGLLATTVALKARTNRLQRSDSLKLATAVLQWAEDMPAARAAVLAFLTTTPDRTVQAGKELQAAIQTLIHEDLGRDPAEVLAAINETPNTFDWETRKDCGHD